MFAPPTPLGIGWSYFPTAPRLNASVRDLIDFAELSPDMLCRESYTEHGPRMAVQPALLATHNNQPLSILQLNLLSDNNFEAASVIGVFILLMTIGVAIVARVAGLRLGPS